MGIRHYSNIYKAPIGITLPSIIRTTKALPRFIEPKEIEELNSHVTREELEAMLKCFHKDKIPGPDGWSIEFFSSFLDIIGDYLIQTIKESRKSGRILEAFNSTFLALIPKSDNPSSFEDYRPFLSQMISKEQFAFLSHHQIHEAIGTAQEALHSIKKLHKKSVILKIDLCKAFDHTCWS